MTDDERDRRMEMARLLGKAEARIEIAAERLERGDSPKEVAGFLREALRDLGPPPVMGDGK